MTNSELGEFGPPVTNNKRNSDSGEIRGDLIKRLFAVAISVGAASTLARMEWVQKGIVPALCEWQQLSILGVAMTATVLSWDGYLKAIKSRPLDRFWRFAIDIALVFIYMFLLMTSNHHTWWLCIHMITFIFYFIWDILTVVEYPGSYYKRQPLPKGLMLVVQVYGGGLLNSKIVSPSPVITLSWGIYFVLLWLFSKNGLDSRIFVTSALALYGLVMYRKDKNRRYTMWIRAWLIASGLAAAFFYMQYHFKFDDEFFSEVFASGFKYVIGLF